MDRRVIYCTGCDRDVTVLLRDGHEGDDPYEELCGAACLEIGRECTGTTCPICAVPADDGRAGGARAEDLAAA